jgi:pimeloyl-ACP methyl ester carboxylesterase
MPFYFRGETKELNQLTRKDASGSFARLSNGFTHYEVGNPEAKETVVLVHGFSVPYFIYDPTFKFLMKAGFRVVRYDLFGRGFSDRPNTRYKIDLFVRQLSDLLNALHCHDPVTLVGLSTGGPITAAFTVRFPTRVNKLVLIDPVGAKSFRLGRLLKIAAMPRFGEVLISLLGHERMIKRMASDFANRRFAEEFRAKYLIQMQYKGFKRAILSTIRNNMLGTFIDDYRRIGKMNKPVLLFWGQQDHTVPFKHNNILRAAIPHIQFHAIENGGHIPHYEKPEAVNPILLKFLRSNS